jgi:serine/threonine protein phosphatase 1
MKRLFSFLAKKPQWALSEGRRVYAVGDIHGRRDLLDVLLAQIAEDDSARGPAETVIIFLGDLVDRGPDSAGVVERLVAFAKEKPSARFLMGNHDEVFLKAAEGDAAATRYLVRIGGEPTILSYGIDPEEYRTLDYETLAQRFAAAVPPEHLAFISGFEQSIALDDYLFVHAGVRPGVALDAQEETDLRWIREHFLGHDGDFGKCIVHGHTISDNVEARPNRIGIDTGAYMTGRLTALGLEGADRWSLST